MGFQFFTHSSVGAKIYQNNIHDVSIRLPVMICQDKYIHRILFNFNEYNNLVAYELKMRFQPTAYQSNDNHISDYIPSVSRTYLSNRFDANETPVFPVYNPITHSLDISRLH